MKKQEEKQQKIDFNPNIENIEQMIEGDVKENE